MEFDKISEKKRLRIARFFNYLEKYKIYELFYELITLLIIKRPKNHLSFMKESIQLAANLRDTVRIILLSSPNFDRKILAEYLELMLGIRTLSLENIPPIQSDEFNTIGNFAKNVGRILIDEKYQDTGWLFIDFPRNKSEARALQRIGILPTHVIEIVSSDKSDRAHSGSNAEDRKMRENIQSRIEAKQKMDDLHICSLRDVYANKLMTVAVGKQTYKEVGNLIINKITQKQRYCVPCIFRILIIGSRGSGRRTVACYLSKKYGLVHVHFDNLLDKTRKLNCPLGEELRWIEKRWGTLPKSDTRFEVVKNKLMSHECINKGWILTGYPLTVNDFQLLNSLTTPPNRIIFLHVDQVTCRERLLSRKFNLLTGSEHRLTSTDFQPSPYFLKFLCTHPNDFKSRVDQDLQEFHEHIGGLLEYAGDSVNIVNGNDEERIVCERVEACLIRSQSIQVTCALDTRISKLSQKMNPQEVVHDPDDVPAAKLNSVSDNNDSEFSLI